jgi:hypothetical protein
MIPPTRRRSFRRLSVAGCDAQTAPEGNRAIGTALIGPVSAASPKRPPAPPISTSVHASISLRPGPTGLGIVSNRLIGDDGARPEVGWVPLAMDEPPAPRFHLAAPRTPSLAR